jgi:prepilin-type N-terminal cleavage/methylation domain-containing protein
MKSFAIHKQFRAFTLLELLVGMIVSGIVLTATFSAYRIITKQYENYRDKSESNSEVSFFASQLEFDFANSENIKFISENEIELRSEKRIMDYRFSEKRILRNDFLRVDTFIVSVSGIETFLKSEKVNSENSEMDELHVMMNIDGKKTEKIYLKVDNAKKEINLEEIGFDTFLLSY